MTLRHERRRRLLTDDGLDGDELGEESAIRIAGGDESADRRARHSDSSRRGIERRVHELVPTSWPMLALVVFGGLALVGVLAALDLWSAKLADALSPEEVAALGFAGTRNLSNWFASILLGLSAAVALFVYSLRKHWADDYHGRYRLWIWTSIACLLASLGETTDTGRLFHGICRVTAGSSGVSEQTLWSITALLVLIAFGVRLLIEVRRCRLAAAAIALSATGFLLAAAISYGWFPGQFAARSVSIERAACLAGYLFLLSAFLFYARYVASEIHRGAEPPRPRRLKNKRREDDRDDRPANEQHAKHSLHVRTDLEPVGKSGSGHSHGHSHSRATDEAADSDDGDSRAMSRAERRRARRQSRMAS